MLTAAECNFQGWLPAITDLVPDHHGAAPHDVRDAGWRAAYRVGHLTSGSWRQHWGPTSRSPVSAVWYPRFGTSVHVADKRSL